MTTVTSPRRLDVQIRAKDNEGRTFTGIGVPYGQEIDLWGERETFAPGSVLLDVDGVPSLLRWEHAETIGKITAGRDTEAGFEIEGQISDTPRGREAATLLKDGVITRLSIGFTPEEYTVTETDDGRDLITHTKVRAMEFSLVSFPAYSAAEISTVRHQTTPQEKDQTMPESLTRADLDEALTPLNDDLDDYKRSLNAIAERMGDNAGPAEPRFRSIGHFLKRVAAGDEAAIELHRVATSRDADERAFSGQTTDGAIKAETFLGTFIKWVQERRRLINLFDTGALPADGMSAEYAQLTENTLKAGKQSKEGAELPGPGKVVLKTERESIETYGGWTELSRQVIERSSLPYLDTVMTALGLEYAKATNEAMRSRILSVIAGQKSNGLTLPGSASVFDWRDLIIDAADRYDGNGFDLTGLLVSLDTFKSLQRLTYNEVPALQVQAGNEYSGTLALPKGDGNLASVEVRCMFGEVPAGTAAFYDPIALKTLESPNAPMQLQDDNIINLSRQFSLYGYLSIIAPFPQAIVPVTVAGAGA